MNYIEGKDRTQFQMECMEEYVDENSEVRVIDKVVDVMDLKSLKFNIGNNETTGRPMYEPKDMLKLYIYGYFNGIRSSRKLAKQSKINREVIWLLKGLQPKQRVIADFRKDNSEALFNVFETFVDFCIDLGLYGKKLIAVDGTKIEASASKRKNYSKNKIAKMKMNAQEKIDEYMKELKENDLIDQDITLDLDKAKLEMAIEQLKEKQIFYNKLEKQLDETNENEINFTDKDSKTMKFGAHQGTDLGYNIQTAVDDKYNLIVTYDVSNNSADQG